MEPDEIKPYPSQLNGDHFYICLKEASSKLVIIFSSKDLAPNKFNFWQVGRELPANIIFVNNGKNVWYQNGIPGFGDSYENTVCLFQQWVHALGIEEIYTLGTSMGGYAAVQYGIELNAKILSFAPDTVLNDSYTKSARFLDKDIKPILSDLRQVIACSQHTVNIIVGESDIEDLYSASLLRDFKQTNIITLRGFDHYVPTRLSHNSFLITMLNSFINNKPLSILPNQGEAISKDGFAKKIFSAYKFFKSNNLQKAYELCNDCNRIYPYSDATYFLLGLIDKANESYCEAVKNFSISCALCPNNPDYIFQLANSMRLTGGLKEAIYILRNLIKDHASYSKAYYAIGSMYDELGDIKQSIEFVKKALQIEPKNISYKNRYKSLLKKKNKLSENAL